MGRNETRLCEVIDGLRVYSFAGPGGQLPLEFGQQLGSIRLTVHVPLQSLALRVSQILTGRTLIGQILAGLNHGGSLSSRLPRPSL